MIIDLHSHTRPKSFDSLLSPSELVLRAKKAGLDGICLTEHDLFWNNETAERLGREHDFLVIPGSEIDTEEGHIVVFGVNEYKFGMQHINSLRVVLDRVGGFMILSHPYRRVFFREDIEGVAEQYSQKSVFKFVDTIEVLNGRGTTRQNEFSQVLGQKLGWQGTGGSDAHGPEDVPTCATKFERKIRNVEELVQELKAGRYQPVDLRQTLV
jgi:predicted metal-dependent phosphoesterase TrpH